MWIMTMSNNPCGRICKARNANKEVNVFQGSHSFG